MDKLLAMIASDPATCFNVVIGIVAVLLVVIIVFAVRLKHARRDKHYLEQYSDDLRTSRDESRRKADLFEAMSSTAHFNYGVTQEKLSEIEGEYASLKAFHEKYKDLPDIEARIAECIQTANVMRDQEFELAAEIEATNKKAKTAEARLLKLQDAYNSIKYAVDRFDAAPILATAEAPKESFFDITGIAPIPFNAMSVNDLRRRYREIQRHIQELVTSYVGRYSTKSSEAIYTLMTMGMQSELNNIISAMKFGKLEEAQLQVKALITKYSAAAANGNMTIVGTLVKFTSQLEYLYMQAVETEYEYYTRRETAREEQRALKEQMRIEAAERKLLEEEQRKIEAEAQKYAKELERLNALVAESQDEAQIEAGRAQIAEITAQMEAIETKKAEIVNLQNGKAGTVYVISNIGAFGEDVFKIGMTRRLEPQDRINELSSASVPFPFDVHSFIFSDDAVSLENQLHEELNQRRVNKVNVRKEFFRIPVEELQELVQRIDPSAEFTLTAAAEQYYQSQSITEVPTVGDESACDDEEPEQEENDTAEAETEV